MGKDKAKGIMVFIEQFEHAAMDISWELLGKGRELADKAKEPLIALVMGDNVDHIAEEAVWRGADEVIQLEDPLLEHYKPENYTYAAYKSLKKSRPNQLIFGATPNGRDLAGRLAVKLQTGLTADVVSLDTTNDGLMLGQVPGFGGSVFAVIKCPEARPQMATVRPGIFDALPIDKKKKGKIKKFDADLEEKYQTTRLIKLQKVEGIDISKAKRLVAGGRGLAGDMSNLKLLAEVLGAEIGVTRPLCDDGHFPRDHQVGSTGVTVKPDIAINFGISGAAHYTAGISKAGTIISINTDPEATIFEFSDYEVVGDVNKIMPLLLEKLKAKLAKEVAQ